MNLNIVIPAAGDGVRFKEKGHKELKPFIRFMNKTMLEHLIIGFMSKNIKLTFI